MKTSHSAIPTVYHNLLVAQRKNNYDAILSKLTCTASGNGLYVFLIVMRLSKKTKALFQLAKFALVGSTNTLLPNLLNIAILYLFAPLALS